MQVSVHELKNHLSHYLHRAEAGEFIVVTSHNKPLAKLIPLPQSIGEDANILLQIEGITWNGKKPQGGGIDRPKITGKTVSEYVIEDRR